MSTGYAKDADPEAIVRMRIFDVCHPNVRKSISENDYSRYDGAFENCVNQLAMSVSSVQQCAELPDSVFYHFASRFGLTHG